MPETVRSLIERAIQTLTVPAAEYVPAISDALNILDRALATQPAQGVLAAGEAGRLAAWLDAKWSRHGEIEDKQAADMLRSLAAPTVADRVPLSDEQIEAGRRDTFSTDNPYCPCDSKTMRKAVRWAERKHGIGAEKTACGNKRSSALTLRTLKSPA